MGFCLANLAMGGGYGRDFCRPTKHFPFDHFSCFQTKTCQNKDPMATIRSENLFGFLVQGFVS